MSITKIDIATIAQGFKVRQKLRGPTLLFLGAKAGALFHSQTLYDALKAFSPRSFATLDQVTRFHECIGFLEKESFSDTDIHYILSRSLEDSFVPEIDRYIATLVKYNLFQLIATTNIDVGLEAALNRIGLRVKDDFDVFLPGVPSSKPIPALSQEDAHLEDKTLVKLYGELALGKYDLKLRNKFFAGNVPLFHNLRRMRDWNILMVGFDPLWDAAIVPLLLPCTGTLWYVNEETPPPNSAVFKLLEQSNAQCLLSPAGSSEVFFRSLYHHMLGSAPLHDSQAELVSTDREQTTPTEVAKPPREPQVSFRGLPSPRVPKQVDVLLLTTNEHGLEALLDEQHLDMREFPIRGSTCYDLGKIQDANVCLLQAHGAEQTIAEQIQELSPACIIILGTAWGFSYKGQITGGLLIPDRVLIHDIEQENKKQFPTTNLGTGAFLKTRTQRVVPKQLINLFECGNIMLNRKTKKLVLVTFGPLFSSTKATDPQTAFHYVSKFAPHAVGIETSGARLFSLAQRYLDNCLLVTGISSLVDVAEAKEQPTSVQDTLANAANFILQVIALGGFRDLGRGGKRAR